MPRLSINELTTYRWSFEEDVEHYLDAGIQSLSVWRHKLSDFGEEKGIELLLDSGLSVSSLQWAGGFTGSDGLTHQDSIEDARTAIRLAAAMRAGCLVVHSGSRAGHTNNHARRLLTGALKCLLPIACEFGVSLAVEPMPSRCASEWTFLTDIDDTLELLDQFDSTQLKLVFDTAHFGHNAAVCERLSELAPRIGIVHLADAKEPLSHEQNRCRLGEGSIPLEQMISTLVRAGYIGYFDVKLMGEEIEAADYAELITHSRNAFEQLTSATV
ncbi:MAG: sugar phosphate isomerase/epimerase [Planctomycetaceae bacterium]|nr:sugar phosphate isomerase/epimerase [Planctomycetales bacterium]MCB9926774.1 sugar phosphate isomerase/epimerase [Planctomycetaceae bacterium]